MELIAIILLIFITVLPVTLIYDKYKLFNVKYECFFESDEYFEGDEAEFTEIITNNKFLPLPWLKSEISVSKYLEFSELHSVVTDKTRFVTSFFSVKGFSRVRRTWKVKCLKRGCYTIEDIIVTASDVLGFSKSTMFINKDNLEKINITVLPLCEECSTENGEKSILSGDTFTKAKLIPDPFFINGLREYSITDSMKSINWYATAKEQKLMVNKNDYTTNRSVAVILNIQSSPSDITTVVYRDYIEKCIRICAGIIKECCKFGLQVRFMCNSLKDDSPVDVISTDFMALFRELAALDFFISDAFDKYLSYTVPAITESEIIVVSSFETRYFDILRNENHLINFVIPDISGGVLQ